MDNINRRSFLMRAILMGGTALFPFAAPAETGREWAADGEPDPRGYGKVSELDRLFQNPPASARPTVYWFWMGQNITRAGITGDLEAIKAAGFGGMTMCNLGDLCTPWPCPIANSPLPDIVPYVSVEWWDLLHFAAEESERLGLEFGFHNCPGYESSGGPWIPPELSMQQICFSATPVSGTDEMDPRLPHPIVDPHAQDQFPVFDADDGKVEVPVISARETFYRDVAALALPAAGVVAKEDVIDLSSRLNADGELRWTPPPGKWIIYRFGHTTEGTLNQPAPWKATGLECDKMNPDAVAFHLNHVLGEIKKHCSDVIGKGLDFIWYDSYEAGTPSWTPKMRAEFLSRRGYDLTPYLPTFAGRIVGSAAETQQFNADFKVTISDLYYDGYFAVSEKMVHAAGLKIHSEPYGGPWNIPKAVSYFDEVAGEFWCHGGKYKPYAVEEVVAGVRLAQKNIVNAEAFTAQPGYSLWNETPDYLKTIGDAAFCAGVNRFMLHRFTHEPFGEKYRPGIVMGQWGTHFDRTQTWWEQGKTWVKYLQRCQVLLQQGAIAENDFATASMDGGLDLKSIHRRDGENEIYFVANLARTEGAAVCVFNVAGKQPELWNPVTGATHDLPEFEIKNGKTFVPLKFAAAESCFLVFRDPVSPATKFPHAENFPPLQVAGEITSAWQVKFDPQWGGPEDPVDFFKLDDWTKRPEQGVKYYSGTARYTTTFDLNKHSAGKRRSPIYLSLGVVKDLAQVRLNGRDLGVVWCAPWLVEISGAVKTKNNKLEIDVVNCWANRLIGDEQEPADCEWLPGYMGFGEYLKRFPDWFVNGTPRPSKNRFTFTTWNYFDKNSPLLPAGLLGPVQLLTES